MTHRPEPASAKKPPKWLFLFLLPNLVMIILLVMNAAFPLPKEKSFSKVILSSDGTLLSAYLTDDQKWRMETRLEDVNPDMVKAVIAKEDQYFYVHPGVNPLSVLRALGANIFYRKRTSGASTITMQLARLIEPENRSYFNKLRQMLRAVQLEWYYPKKRILELYLSYVPLGGNVEGIKAASYIYFNRAPSKLSLAQDVLLIVIPNRPNSLRLDRFTAESIGERNKWLKKFNGQHVFSRVLISEALSEPVTARRNEIPVQAPHFCMYASKEFPGNELRTTIDLALQKKAETLLFNHIQRCKSRQVNNGAVIIIDNRTMQVKAYCGSADFYNTDDDGQVNGAEAYRSPGSTLKPFLYGLAMDKGTMTPQTMLLDVPTNINGYVPENFDLKYRGEVSASFALVQSLNIPAIRLLNSYGIKDFKDFLIHTEDFSEIKRMQKHIGLSMILGGCGVSLHQLTYAYTAFANGGVLRPLHCLQNDSSGRAVRMFSPEASWLITDILSTNKRPDIPNYLNDASELPKVAFKTGTSFGRKDAWAIGVNPNYTIGVWMGNFDGHGAPELSGAEMAVPLLFDLFNSADALDRKSWFARPAGIGDRLVCKESGLVPDSTCTDLVPDYYIKNVSGRQVCHLYKQIYVNPKADMQYCTACLPVSGYIKKSYPIYPAELALWFKENGVNVPMPPPHNPACTGRFDDDGPKILSPSADLSYFMDEDAPQQIMLQAASDATVHEHYWYVDDTYYQKTAPGEKLFFMPKPGDHKISCMDDKGRSESIMIKVKKL